MKMERMICPEAGWHLSGEMLEGNTVTCNSHGSKFDITTGKGISGNSFPGRSSCFPEKGVANQININANVRAMVAFN
jgi:nitrite reductase/ring-hydroxylating ferredoxin subunit